MINLKISLGILFVFFYCLVFSQSIPDNSGRDVFVVRTINKFSTGVQTSSAKVSFNSIQKSVISYRLQDDTSVHLTKSSHSFGIELGARNITQSYSRFFSNLNQPTVELSAGWIVSNVTNINNWHSLKEVINWNLFVPRTYDFYIGGFISNSFINYYDTVNRSLTETWSDFGSFYRFGMRSNLNLYYTDWLVFAINLSIDYGRVTDDLRSFQNTVPDLIAGSPVVVVDLGKMAGKYGGEISSTFNSRLSFSAPIFLGNLFFKTERKAGFGKMLGGLAVIPHYSPFGSAGATWTQVFGVSINFLAQRYGRLNATIKPGAGIGVDWRTDVSDFSNWSGPIYYVYGTIDLGKLVLRSDKPAKVQRRNEIE